MKSGNQKQDENYNLPTMFSTSVLKFCLILKDAFLVKKSQTLFN